MWLFLGNISKDNTCEDVKKHVTELIKKTDFECSKIDTKYSTNCYKLGVTKPDYNILIKPESWPSNIKISRFFFKYGTQRANVENFQETRPPQFQR